MANMVYVKPAQEVSILVSHARLESNTLHLITKKYSLWKSSVQPSILCQMLHKNQGFRV